MILPLQVRNGLGKVKKIDSDGDVIVRTDAGPMFAFNPECLEVVDKDTKEEAQTGLFKRGAGVRITVGVDLETMKLWQSECGGWIPEMAEVKEELSKGLNFDCFHCYLYIYIKD